MTTFEHLTIGELLDWLRSQDDAMPLHGLTMGSDSYRAFYAHVAIEPGSGCTVGELREAIESKLGTMMYGYRGGEYPFNEDCLVYVAEWGRFGHMLCGFIGSDPVLVHDRI